MDVEPGQLRSLVAVVEQGTFTDAAIALGVSQAAVSRSVARLETVLGVRLFRRTSREVTLTAAGSRVLPHARQLLREQLHLCFDRFSFFGKSLNIRPVQKEREISSRSRDEEPDTE